MRHFDVGEIECDLRRPHFALLDGQRERVVAQQGV